MKCERIQEFILTDYSDGQLTAQWQREVEAHLKDCPACAGLAQQVSMHVMNPLKQLHRLAPDESVWLSIKASIQPSPEAYVQPQLSWVDRLRQFMLAFRPALITTCVFLIIGAVVLNNRLGVKHQPYLSYLMSEEAMPITGHDTASRIEQYFL